MRAARRCEIGLVPAPRLRPGERPIWWNATADRDQFAGWRAAAGAQELAVDVWASLLVELDLVLGDLAAVLPAPEAVLRRLLGGGESVRALGPATALRGWLEMQSGDTTVDELPELLLPERVAARLTPGAALSPRLREDRIELAISCDSRAARQGRTLESWALAAALRVASLEEPQLGREPRRLE